MTLTYIELEHAQPNQHVVLLGVVDRHGPYSNTKPTICSSRGQCRSISSKAKLVFFAVFDSLVAITTHPGAQNSRSGRFRGNDNRRTKRLLYPLLRMRVPGNYPSCACTEGYLVVVKLQINESTVVPNARHHTARNI